MAAVYHWCAFLVRKLRRFENDKMGTVARAGIVPPSTRCASLCPDDYVDVSWNRSATNCDRVCCVARCPDVLRVADVSVDSRQATQFQVDAGTDRGVDFDPDSAAMTVFSFSLNE